MRIGIDLGTTNTVVSYIDENGCWCMLEFHKCGSTENPHFLPSCIAVKNGIIIVGQPAVDHGLLFPGDLLKDQKYTIGSDKKSTIGGYTLTSEQVAEYILKEVYNELRRQFPYEKTFNAFVTVPARFGTEARLATKSALKNAGFETDENCLTDEPIAAAIAYSSQLESDKLVLVVDIGGGTFDLSLLKTTIVIASGNSNRLEPVSWDGDTHLGGNDVDELLVKKMTMAFVRAGGKDLYVKAGSDLTTEEETRAAAAIRSLALPLKKQLYADGSEKASIFFKDLLDGIDLDFSISRGEYENDMGKISTRMMQCLENIFVSAGCSSGDVDHVLVVGGMAHEICLKKMLESMFGDKKLIIPDDSMYLVSKGAAISNSNLRVHVENKAYTSIGLLTKSGTDVDVIIKEGSTVQSGHIFEDIISPSDADATAVVIELVEFRGKFSADNYTVIMREVVQLVEDTKLGGKFIDKLFHKKKKPKLLLKIEFTEDKLFRISVEQSDGSTSNMSLRLGGK